MDKRNQLVTFCQFNDVTFGINDIFLRMEIQYVSILTAHKFKLIGQLAYILHV